MTDPMVDRRCLAGVAEVATLLRVGRTTVATWHARRVTTQFPPTVAHLAAGPVFDIEQVVAWYMRYQPRKGKRPGVTPCLGPDGSWIPNPRGPEPAE